jgi:2-iminobutanoate/2-iminopropanoate deaminase
MPRTTTPTDQAPQPAGPYSQNARVGAVVQAAGQVGLRPDGTLLEGVGDQTRQALRNVLAVLEAAGARESDIISVRVFLTDVSHFQEMNAAYETAFSQPPPARTTVYVGLPAGLLVEIDALAVVEGDA